MIHNQNTTMLAQKILKLALIFCGVIIALLIYFLFSATNGIAS